MNQEFPVGLFEKMIVLQL